MFRSPVVWLNGSFVTSTSDARVSIFDRGYLHGDSVFETLRAYGGRVFRGREHLERFDRAADLLGIVVPHREEIPHLTREAVARLDPAADAAIRVTVSRGEGPPGIATLDCKAPVLSITAQPLHPYPPEYYRTGIATSTVSVRRVPPECLPSEVKTGNYLPSVLARRELDAKGMIEGIMLAIDGQVVCGTVSNVFAVRGGDLWTPPSASGCREGVTRAALLELAPRVGLRPTERRLEVKDLALADEVFFANTIMECLPVSSLNGHAYAAAPGPVTRALQRAFSNLVREELAEEDVGGRAETSGGEGS